MMIEIKNTFYIKYMVDLYDTLSVRVSNKLYPLLLYKGCTVPYTDHNISKKPQFISTLNEYIQHELYSSWIGVFSIFSHHKSDSILHIFIVDGTSTLVIDSISRPCRFFIPRKLKHMIRRVFTMNKI